jgi:UDP-3-O-[3-hydroxymyristoyl] N-acetylglucosamine deacetylase
VKTIKNGANISGTGLMSGHGCNVSLFPSNKKGIKFFTTGSKTPIIADYRSILSTDNCVILGNSNNDKVILVEHFMAACAFAGINSLDVCIDFPELPILDGSGIVWHELFNNTGYEGDNEIEQTSFDQPVFISSGKTTITLIPAEKTMITYCINFDHPDLRNRWASFEPEQGDETILSARTFGYAKDLEKFQQAGLALGVTADNIVGLTEDGYTAELRSDYEPAKHKILDIIGDLYLTGRNPLGFKAHIIAKDAGHKSHTEFAGKLAGKAYSSAFGFA